MEKFYVKANEKEKFIEIPYQFPVHVNQKVSLVTLTHACYGVWIMADVCPHVT